MTSIPNRGSTPARTGWRYALPLDTALVTSRVRVRARVGGQKTHGVALSHEAAVSGDIGGENSREPTFDPLSAQCSLRTRMAARLCFPFSLRPHLSSIDSLKSRDRIRTGSSGAQF